MAHILITGGAGFLGGHLAERLASRGDRVRLLDNLSPQVHGGRGLEALPIALRRDCEFRRGDVTSPSALDRALAGVDAVVHLAAAVGVGQSMYRIAEYCRSNLQGTAELLQAILRRRQRPRGEAPRRLVIASSMSVYGEGCYRCPRCGPVAAAPRSREQLAKGEWEPACRQCGGQLTPLPTSEEKAAEPHSIYAVTKLAQEQMALNFGRAYDIPVVALRFFNIYGPRQALENPYTGVVAIFCARLRAGQPLMLFEDGEQRRDFVSVHDAVGACLAALADATPAGAYNIASGETITIRRLAAAVAEALQRPLRLAEGRRYRIGDIRHCMADISRARRAMAYEPRVSLSAGLAELTGWLDSQAPPAGEILGLANQELRAFGLGG